MRIIDKQLVQSIKWTDSQSYDVELSELCRDGQSFVIINPELPNSVLDLIDNINIESNSCLKFKVGNGWIAKKFPGEWNGKTQIIQLPVMPCEIITSPYITGQYSYTPDAWDLKYAHVWIYDKALTGGQEVDAVVYKYIKETSGKKIIGTASVNVDNDFEIVFISNGEPNADSNYSRLISKFPKAKRVDRVQGILNAHQAAASIVSSELFWVVDADAYILDNFNFNFIPYIQDRATVHIWHSRNPINGLEYGYGAVKLFPRKLLLSKKQMPIDVSTSLGPTRVIKEVACETRFNTDPFNTWKSAFRECAKLSSKTITNQLTRETEIRLAAWCNLNESANYGIYSYLGALEGKAYGENYSDNLNSINNFEWLYDQFKKHTNN